MDELARAVIPRIDEQSLLNKEINSDSPNPSTMPSCTPPCQYYSTELSKFEFQPTSSDDSASRYEIPENAVLVDSSIATPDNNLLNDTEDIFYTRSIIPEPEEDTTEIEIPSLPFETSYRVWADMVSPEEAQMLQHAANLPLWNAFYTIQAMMSEYRSFRVADVGAGEREVNFDVQ